MDLGLKDKLYLITGASRGLGFACAKILAAEEAHVVLNSRSEEHLKDAAEKIKQILPSGGKVDYIAADISDPNEVERLYEEFIKRFGVPDGILINAGGPPTGSVLEMDEERWDLALQTNLLSAIRITRRFVPKMIERGFGRIVAITSMSAKMPLPNLVLSNTTRAGVVAYMKTLANEVGPHGILANCLLPGTHKTERLMHVLEDWAKRAGVSVEEMERIKTEQIPLRRFGDPEEFGIVAAFLLSPKNTYITGQAIAVDGGYINSLL